MPRPLNESQGFHLSLNQSTLLFLKKKKKKKDLLILLVLAMLHSIACGILVP